MKSHQWTLRVFRAINVIIVLFPIVIALNTICWSLKGGNANAATLPSFYDKFRDFSRGPLVFATQSF
jgi:hypothetical protein